MPESTRRLGRGAAFRRAHVLGDDRNLEPVRVVVLVQNVRHQRAEAAAEVAQPGHVFLQIRNDDGDVLKHRLLHGAEIVVGQGLSRIQTVDHGAHGGV